VSVLAISTAILLADVSTSSAVPPPAVVDSPAPAITMEMRAPVPDVAPPPVSSEEPVLLAAADPIDPNTITVTARPPAREDPLQGVNSTTYSVTQSVDQAIVAPVSLAYKHAFPSRVRSGVRNVLENLHEPVVFVNFLLQHKIGKAAETLGRIVVNSTLGVAGLMDVAKKKPFNLPHRPNGFAFTLGYYGVKTGPFLFLPIIGPTTVRDIFGRWVDLLILPAAIGKPFNTPAYSISTVTFTALDERVQNDDQLTKLREGNSDPYAAMRKFYLDNRQAEIDALRGSHKPVDAPAAVPVAPEKGTPPPVG
jgi:phospholipid-binding lipoprotein MlaA